MQIEILHSPGNAVAKVNLEAGEKLIAESGSMIAMSKDLDVTVSSRTKGGGALKAFKRALGGESFFLNHFSASNPGEVFLAPTLIGDMKVHHLQQGQELMVQGSSFVACADSVEMDTKWSGFKKSLFSGESMFWLRFSGQGPIIVNSFGAIYEREIDGDYIVDTGHVVAFEKTLDFDVRKAGGSWLSAILGGEGLVCQFNGRGKLYCQSHHPSSFGKTLGPKLKPRP